MLNVLHTQEQVGERTCFVADRYEVCGVKEVSLGGEWEMLPYISL